MGHGPKGREPQGAVLHRHYSKRVPFTPEGARCKYRQCRLLHLRAYTYGTLLTLNAPNSGAVLGGVIFQPVKGFGGWTPAIGNDKAPPA